MQVEVRFSILTDSKDFFSSLTSQLHPIDKSVSSDLYTIRLNLEITVDISDWNRDSGNLADIGTKLSSPFVKTIAFAATTGIIHPDLKSLEIAPWGLSPG